jgi:glyoxylase-like metal-dependent hydrolase (beta-lactamase superfamily II)/rhodanese-related sulfurtransferase
MIVEQLYTSCLAQGAYYIQSEGEAAVIDPLREYKPYLDLAAKNNATIKYVFETHFHADFVSGHLDLAKNTGADIVFGPNAQTDFKSVVAKDNQEFKIGKLTIKVLHTPGHTLESSSFLLFDENQKPHCLFSGDTLFIGDVGRPDLAIKSDLTQEDLAGMLYDSLHNKIMVLPDDVIVYPAHGAGSACGKNMSKETFDTLGNQKKTNYALANITKSAFIKELTTGILPAPQYFAKNAKLNKSGYDNYDDIAINGSKALSINEVKQLLETTKAIILDVRKPQEFAKEHIPNSIFIGIDGQFAPWVGALITDIKQPIILVTPTGREEETVMRLSRVGYDHCIGFVEGGVIEWKHAGNKTSSILSISADEFTGKLNNTSLDILDVRKPGEYEASHLVNVNSKPLDFITDWQDGLAKDKEYHIHCAGGYRSMIAASILKRNGYDKLIDVAGGYGAIQKTNAKTTEFICPSTLKKKKSWKESLLSIFK